MKKSVMILIVSLSTVAIIVIGLLFQRAEVYDATIYINQIVITDIRLGDELLPTYFDPQRQMYLLKNTAAVDENDPPSTYLNYAEDLTVDVIYAVGPTNATSADVIFFKDDHNEIADIDRETGRIHFNEAGTVTFTVRAADSLNVYVQLQLRARAPRP